jgi:hypothetical protein
MAGYILDISEDTTHLALRERESRIERYDVSGTCGRCSEFMYECTSSGERVEWRMVVYGCSELLPPFIWTESLKPAISEPAIACETPCPSNLSKPLLHEADFCG